MNRVKTLVWRRDPRLHAEAAYVKTETGERRVALLINETHNPLRPKGAPPPDRPYTLEVYLPMPAGRDRVTKFTMESRAKSEAARALARFIHDATF